MDGFLSFASSHAKGLQLSDMIRGLHDILWETVDLLISSRIT